MTVDKREPAPTMWDICQGQMMLVRILEKRIKAGDVSRETLDHLVDSYDAILLGWFSWHDVAFDDASPGPEDLVESACGHEKPTS